jgi:hypothetical protein
MSARDPSIAGRSSRPAGSVCVGSRSRAARAARFDESVTGNAAISGLSVPCVITRSTGSAVKGSVIHH